MALDWASLRPSASTITGNSPAGLIFRKSGDWVSFFSMLILIQRYGMRR